MRTIKPLHIVLGAALFMLMTCSAPLAPLLGEPRALNPDAPGLARPDSGRSRGPTATPARQAIAPTRAPERQPAPTAPPIAPTSSPTADQLAQGIDRYLADLTSGGLFSGSVLVAQGDRVLLAKGYGPFDSEGRQTNTPQTIFRLASLTKQFTAAGIMLLQSQGKLSTSDSICAYLDDCPEAWRPVTLRHLLNHTSGIFDYTDSLEYEATESIAATPQQLLSRFRDQPLAFAPGDYYDYCNSGYVLLGMAIERASGMPYGAFMQQAIFAPLGMQQSGYDANESFAPDQAFPFRSAGVKATFLNTTTLYAAGALYSTVEDLYRWDQALSSEQLLPRALLDEVFTPGNGSYGYGWKIERPGGRLRISHAGNMTGVSNFLARYPEQRLTVIVLSNMESTNAIGISDYIAAQVLGP
jgi:CubicO group peptidase (beta-lactamase class C family)